MTLIIKRETKTSSTLAGGRPFFPWTPLCRRGAPCHPNAKTLCKSLKYMKQ
jgi:hypothetical protein